MKRLRKEIYLNNYWPLFLDFIERFSELTFQGIPLPILANFYQFLDTDVKEEMTDPGFEKHLQTKILKDKQVQPEFERWLNPIKNPLKKVPQGKLLLNLEYLRFSQNNYPDYFNPDKTIILAGFKRGEYQGIPIHCLKDYKLDVRAKTESLIEETNSILTSVSTHRVWGNPFFRNTFLTRLPKMVETIAAVNHFLEEKSVSCIIVGTTEDLTSRILTIIAAKNGIPSICMQHGLLGGPEAFIPVFSTKMAVYGQSEKDWYHNKGLPENRIAITGHPRYDDIFTQNHMSKVQFQKLYNLDFSKKTILLATQPNYNSLWSEFIEILAKDLDLQIIIKPHPWEALRRIDNTCKSMDSYEYFANKYKSIRLVSSNQKVSLFDILSNVDLVVCNYSTVGLEGLLFNKPLFILSEVDIDYYHVFDNFTRSNPVELSSLIFEYDYNLKLQKLAKKKRDEFLAYAYPQKLAGVRLLAEIKNLTS